MSLASVPKDLQELFTGTLLASITNWLEQADSTNDNANAVCRLTGLSIQGNATAKLCSTRRSLTASKFAVMLRKYEAVRGGKGALGR